MPLFVRFWGTRGSIPTPGQRTRRFGGNTACVEIRAGDALLICDAGTGIREFGLDLQRRLGPRPLEAHVFLSHLHWDHIQGFPFFTPAYARANTLHVHGRRVGAKGVDELLATQMEKSYFPVRFTELGARILVEDLPGSPMEVAGVRVTTFAQDHPGGSVGFVFEQGGKKIVYATDTEIDRALVEPELAESKPEALRRLPDDLLRQFEGAELVVADGQYTDLEYPRRTGWGHARATTLVDLAVEAGVKQVAITHHDPMHADGIVDAMVESCQQRAQAHGSGLVVFGAREGVELKLDGAG